MNGTWKNWLKHAFLAMAIVLIAWLLPRDISAGLLAVVFFWAKEAGEKSKEWDAPGRPLSDWNPFGSRWSFDDRMDLASAVAGAILFAGLLAIFG